MSNQLDAILEQFKGKSADDIAEMVKRRHIKGRLGTTSKCPMAILLDNVGTGRYIIGRKYIVRRVNSNSFEKARTPEQVAVFVRKFDLGKYPHLIAPPPRCLAPAKSHKAKPSSGTRGHNKRAPIKHHLAKLVGRFHGTAAE